MQIYLNLGETLPNLYAYPEFTGILRDIQLKRGNPTQIDINIVGAPNSSSKVLIAIKRRGSYDGELVAFAETVYNEYASLKLMPSSELINEDLGVGTEQDRASARYIGEIVIEHANGKIATRTFDVVIHNDLVRVGEPNLVPPYPVYPPADMLVSRADVGKANGVAALDGTGKIPSIQLTINDTLTSYASNVPLSANQGRNLNYKISALEASAGGGGGVWDGSTALSSINFNYGFSCFGNSGYAASFHTKASFYDETFFNRSSYSQLCASFQGRVVMDGEVHFRDDGGSFECDMPASMHTLRISSGINFSGSGRDVTLSVSSDNKLMFDGSIVGGGGGSWDGGIVTKETRFNGGAYFYSHTSFYSSVRIVPYSGSPASLAVEGSARFAAGAEFSGGAAIFNGPANFYSQVAFRNYPIQSQYGYSFNSEVGIYYSQSGGGVTIKGASFSAPVGISCGGLSVSSTTTLWSILEFGGTAYSYLNSLEGCGLSWDNTTKKLNLHYYSNGVQQTEALNP